MKLPVPSVPDLARLKGETLNEMTFSLQEFYETSGAIFNYISGTRSVRFGYKGIRNIEQLKAGCNREKTAQGKKSNIEIVENAAPIAFGRDLSVFDLPRRQFSFGREHRSSYRVPFFFVENRIIKLYYLQPRKGSGLSFDSLGMIAAIHKRFLLDTEFFGEECDVEYVDVSALPGQTKRLVRSYGLADLKLWSDKRLADRLSLISEAIEHLQNEGLVRPRKSRPAQPAADMPLF